MGRKSVAQVEAKKVIAKFDVNYANNADVRQRALDYVLPMVSAARDGRRAKEEEWLEDLTLWSCQNTDASMYEGRSNLIIPELHNQVESSVNKYMDGLFPNDDYLGCIPLKRTKREEAEEIKAAVFHELDHKNQLPSLMVRNLRNKVLYGTSFIKVGFEKTMKTVFLKQAGRDYPEAVETPKYQGVKIKSMDTFHTYAWPETVEDIQDCEIVFDEAFISKPKLLRDKLYTNVKDLHEVNPDFAQAGWIENARLSLNNLSTAQASRKNAILVTEIWCDFDIVEGEFVPCVITLGNLVTPIRVQRNPYWHQLKPYLMSRYIQGPAGETYGHSLSERLRSLQYMMTDLANQTMDSMNFSLNPIALIDPGYAGDVNSFKVQPGAKWSASPQGVQFTTFPDISQSGFNGMQQIRGMIQQFSDTAPSTAPQLSGKVRSATQADAVQNEISQNMRNMVRTDEADVMSMLGYMAHELLKQYMPEEYQIATQGTEKGQWITKTINPAVLQKDAMFVWKGSEVAQASAIRNQQMISAFNMAVQMERVIPGKVDLAGLYKKVLYESFGLEDLGIWLEDKQKETVDPTIENLSLMEGEDCDVHSGDDYKEHMQSHLQSLKTEAKTPAQKIAHIKHMEAHVIQDKAQKMLAQQEAELASAKAQLGQEEAGEPPGPPGQLGQQGMGGGNPAQPPSTFQGMTQGIRATQPQ
jgi:hypothetical protein